MHSKEWKTKLKANTSQKHQRIFRFGGIVYGLQFIRRRFESWSFRWGTSSFIFHLLCVVPKLFDKWLVDEFLRFIFTFLLIVNWAVIDFLVLFELIDYLWLIVLAFVNIFRWRLTVIFLNDIFLFIWFFCFSFAFFYYNWGVAHFCRIFNFIFFQNIFPFWLILKFIFIFIFFLVLSFKLFV